MPMSPTSADSERKYRAACNTCHQMKVRCTGTSPCGRCQDSGTECVYAVAAKLGKPKGSRNKKTLERMRQMSKGQQSPAQTPSPPPSREATTPPQEPGGDDALLDLSTPPAISFDGLFTPFEDSDFTFDVVDTQWSAANDAALPVDTPQLNADIPNFPLEELLQQDGQQCGCLRTQMEGLCRLKEAERCGENAHGDTALAISLDALTAIVGVVDCASCQSDYQTLLVIIMQLNVVFRCLLLHLGLSDDAMRLTVGEHTILNDESLGLVRNTLVSLALQKARQSLAGVRGRADRLTSEADAARAAGLGDLDAMAMRLAVMQVDSLFARLANTSRLITGGADL